mgnify:CR=1 FL=1
MMKANTEQKIIRILHDQNPWWESNRVPDNLLKPFKRRDFYVIKEKKLDTKEITAIIGPRQVGKTTVIYQLIDHLINEKKVNPRRILYISFDYPYLTTITKTPVDDILRTYSTHILKEPLSNLADRIYIFLDEVCKLEQWSRVLKGLYDLQRPIKFIISDSSSSDILKGSSESLVGRISISLMFPLKFVDVLKYSHRKKSELFNKVNWELRKAFKRSINKSDPKPFYECLRWAYSLLAPHEDFIKIHLNEYLLKDGYPELLNIESLDLCAEKLRTYLALTIYKDIVRIFNLRDPKALEELVVLIADVSSQRVEYTSLCNILGIKRDTLVNYLNYLESVFLISKAEFYSKSRAARIRKIKKLYLSNVGLRNTLVGMLNEALLQDSSEVGKVVEILLHEHCKRLKFNLERGRVELFYWKTKQGNEVDIVLELFRKPVAIESKYKNEIQKKELKGLRKFLEEHNESFGVVITKDILDLDLKDRMIFIPLWLFLLMC